MGVDWCGDGRWVWTVSGVEMGRRGGCGLWVVWCWGGGKVGLKGVINVSPLTPFISTQRVFVLPWK